MHVLAIGFSPAYLYENSDALREDWPRIPLPTSKETLIHSAEIGRELSYLLDVEQEIDLRLACRHSDPRKRSFDRRLTLQRYRARCGTGGEEWQPQGSW
jgi:hypothetical protein